MNRKLVAAAWCLSSLAAGFTAWSQTGPAQVKAIVQHVLASNEAYMKSHGPQHFKAFVEAQHPRITVVTCSDSRVQMHAFDSSPDNDLFVIRDIGNQIATCEGSVDYGVHHLHTPVLLIIGHVRCGAVQAAMGDFSREPASIKRELDTLTIKKGGDWLEEVKANVSAQVKAALTKFTEEVKEGKLTVIGAVYDFADDLRQGSGRLVLVNVNGDTDPARVKALTTPEK